MLSDLRKKTLSNLTEQIGHTPLVRLKRVLPDTIPPEVEMYAKAEWFNPGGSVKDRAAFRMVSDGLASGRFRKGQTLIDSTSGNTGIAYAMLGAALGFEVLLVMPGNASPERLKIARAYGAQIHLSDPLQGSQGARQEAARRAKADPDRYFFPDQYANDSNWKAHAEGTGPEIWRDTEGGVTHFVAGMGTSGTLMGVGKFLKGMNPAVNLTGLEPDEFHGIEGWKPQTEEPGKSFYDPAVHDEKITVPTEPAYRLARELAAKEGIFAGPSAGGALYGALRVAEKIDRGMIVVLFADAGDRYLSAAFFG